MAVRATVSAIRRKRLASRQRPRHSAPIAFTPPEPCHANARRHRLWKQSLYFSACIGAGLFTLLPTRDLGQRVWDQWLGLI